MLPIWTFFLKKKQFTYLLLITLIVVGSIALVAIPKESAPEVKIAIGIVSVVLPGASAEDVEKLVTNKIEDGLANLSNLNKLTSSSRESLAVITAEFTATADIDKSIQDLKDQVSKIEPELPTEAKTPVVSEVNFADQPILLISVTGDRAPAELTKLGDEVKDILKTVSGVSKVDVSGIRERETQVVVNKEKLVQYGIRLVDVIGALSSANSNLPIGSIILDDVSYALKFHGDITDPSEIQDIAIMSTQGKPVYIRDIATVSDGLQKATTYSRASVDSAPAAPSLTLAIYKSSGGNIVNVANAVKTKLEDLKKTTLQGSDVLVTYDEGKNVNKDLTELTRTGIETVILVMICLFLTIGWRESLVAAASIPLSFLIAFIGLYASGNSINFVSLFALILAIGILVDSGIVITEAIHTRMRKYPTKDEAAIASLKEYAWPLIAGTMATIAVFVPLFFISGVVGKFIASIPFTLIFVLVASLFVALGLVPILAILFTKKEMSKMELQQEVYTEKITHWYKEKLGGILGNKKRENWFLISIVVLFVLSLALPITGVIKSIFFPPGNIDFIFIELEKPQGTTLAKTDFATRKVEEMLYGNPTIESFVTTIGQGSTFNAGGMDTKLANITVNLKADRTVTSGEFTEELRKQLAPIKDIDIRVLEPSSGPPTGAPILIKFMGSDLDALALAVDNGERILKTIPGATEVNTSTKDNGTEFVLTIDKAKATALGLNSTLVAQTLRTAINGITATTIKKQDNDIDVVVKLDLGASGVTVDASETPNTTIDAINQIPIQTPNGPVLLGSIITTKLEGSNSTISHEDRMRIGTLSSYVKDGFTAADVTAEFNKRESELGMTGDTRIVVGGENEEVDRSFMEMGLALIFGMILMLAILVLEFNSIRYTLYLLSIIPLSLIGVFGGLALVQMPLSFPSILGVIALAGVIINHAIILMDSMHRIEEHSAHLTHKEAVIEASASRLRPIVLTTITTVIGMIPLTFASELWGPLAYSIMFGLTFAMVLTLVYIPVLYYRWPAKGVKRT